jgi:hypothetical protein
MESSFRSQSVSDQRSVNGHIKEAVFLPHSFRGRRILAVCGYGSNPTSSTGVA